MVVYRLAAYRNVHFHGVAYWYSSCCRIAPRVTLLGKRHNFECIRWNDVAKYVSLAALQYEVRVVLRVTMRFLLAAVLLVSCLSHAETYEGRVVGVSDGDSITVLDSTKRQHKVRLAGIDAPELRQAFGQASKRSLSALVFGKAVAIETEKRDRYNRQIGKVLVDGRDVNLLQIETGFAWHYMRYAAEQSPIDQRLYSEAESSARSLRKGLWQDRNPQAPWDFRRQQRESK